MKKENNFVPGQEKKIAQIDNILRKCFDVSEFMKDQINNRLEVQGNQIFDYNHKYLTAVNIL